jgi:PadR family transcriptional regulator PadR
MAVTEARQFQKDLNAGLLSLVLLSELARSTEDLYAYELAKRLQGEEDGLFNEGSLYPVLRNMAARGWLSSRIVPSYGGPPRRYYRITDSGRLALQERREAWARMRSFVDRFVGDSAAAD